MIAFSDKAQIVNANGTPTRTLIVFLQNLFSGLIPGTAYTAAELATLAPDAPSRAFCSDSSVTTFGSTVAGGGANVVPVYWNLTAWKVG